jgi:hypothetical protein
MLASIESTECPEASVNLYALGFAVLQDHLLLDGPPDIGSRDSPNATLLIRCSPDPHPFLVSDYDQKTITVS